ncbi:MAG: V-type ATP synthase subunit E [Oscillibacter sp.]|nr:V-type ATP synthase subunit E [Oscillibacter sp.]
MNGIEKIAQRIGADAQSEIDRQLEDARAEAAQITARYQSQAELDSTQSRESGRKEAAGLEERMVNAARLEARKATLAARQEMVERAFDLALEKLCALPDDRYVATAAALLRKAAPDGKGEVIFNPELRERIGSTAVAEANRLLGERGALTLSRKTRPIRGGFILECGKVEVNCSFETLVRLKRSEMAAQVAGCLFPHD